MKHLYLRFALLLCLLFSFIGSANLYAQKEKKAHGIFEDMEKAAALHECGALTDEEYSKIKADLLAKI